MRYTNFSEKLSEIPIEAIAGLAATLISKDCSPFDATKKALELLEIAAAGKSGLERGEGWEVSIDRLESDLAVMDKRLKANYGPDVTPHDDEGNRLPVSFEDALNAVMKGMKRTQRMPKFRDWLADFEGLPDSEKHKRITLYRKRGIPPQVFQSFRLTFWRWHAARTSTVRSTAGTKGAQVKKARQRAS